MTIDGKPAAAYASHTLRRGSRIAIGQASRELAAISPWPGDSTCRWFSAAARPICAPGSAAWTVRRWPPGSRLPLARESTPDGADLWLSPDLWPVGDGVLRVVLGPQDDLFTEAGIATFLSGEYKILPDSDRMGYRFNGPAVEHADDYNIVSDGIARGSVQIVGSGQPIILLADRQTTGGYAKIATVISADLPLLAQLRPGNSVRFEAVSLDEAEELRITMMEGLAHLRRALRTVGSESDLSEHLLHTNLIDGVVGGAF